MTKFFKDPLIHFLLLGGLLFLLFGFLNRNEEQVGDYDILIDQSDIDRLSKSYYRNWNQLPDSLTLQGLIEAEVKAEIFYREALRMNLDHNDEIIRRRLKQKYEFLVKDLTTPQRASEKILKQFYQENPHLYKSSKTLNFHQFYFNPDKRTQPEEDAENTLNKIKNQDFEALDQTKIGDTFHLQTYYAARDIDHVRQLFGQEFAETLFAIEKSGWTAPIRSGYGVHLIYIEEVAAKELMPFEEVKPKVLEDWKANQQVEYSEELFENLRKQYKVRYE